MNTFPTKITDYIPHLEQRFGTDFGLMETNKKGSIFTEIDLLTAGEERFVVKRTVGNDLDDNDILEEFVAMERSETTAKSIYPGMVQPNELAFVYFPFGRSEICVVQQELQACSDVRMTDSHSIRRYRSAFSSFVTKFLEYTDRQWSEGGDYLPDIQLKNIGYHNSENFKIVLFDFTPDVGKGNAWMLEEFIHDSIDRNLITEPYSILNKLEAVNRDHIF